jgi:hypothetical protein
VGCPPLRSIKPDACELQSTRVELLIAEHDDDVVVQAHLDVSRALCNSTTRVFTPDRPDLLCAAVGGEAWAIDGSELPLAASCAP